MSQKRVTINKIAKTQVQEHHHHYTVEQPQPLQPFDEVKTNWLTEKVTCPRWWIILGLFLLMCSGFTFNCHTSSTPSAEEQE